MSNNVIEIKITAQNASALAAIRQVAEAVAQSAAKTKAASANSGDGFKKLGDEASNAAQKAKQSGDGIVGTFAKISMAAYGIIGTLRTVKDIFSTVFGSGIKYDKQMETAQMGIAGILMSMTTLNGKQLQLNQALQISSQTLKQIQESAVRIGLPADDMTSAFQSIIGPGLQAKMTLEELVQFTPTATKAVKTMLGSMADEMQVSQELRSMVSGNIDQDSQVAKALGITSADVEKAKQTAGGLFNYLMNKLSGFKELATVWPDTMTGAEERFKAMFGQASGSASKNVFSGLKKTLNEITDALFVVDEKTKEVSFNPELLSYLKSFVDYTILFGTKIKEAGSVVGPVLLPPLNLILSILKFIIQHIQAGAAALLTWTVIQKAINLFNTLNLKIAAAEKQLIAMKAASTAATSTIVSGAGTATVAIGRMEKALFAVKVAIRGLASATLWGAVSVAAGYAIEQIIDHAEKAKRGKESKKFDISSSDIGNLSSAHEGGSDTVSTGENDPYGGVSYGAWQLSSKQGSATKFVNWLIENGYEAGNFLKNADASFDEYGGYSEGQELIAGTPEFTERWHEAVAKYGDSFYNAQKAYIKEKYYDDTNNTLFRDFGFDANSRSNAIQQVLWSTAVQHGNAGAYDIMVDAANLAGQPNISWLTDEQLIPYIYQARRNAFSQDTDRYNEEQQQAMSLLAANPQQQNTTINTSDLDLKNKQQEAEALANANIALKNAIAGGTLQELIAKLQEQEQALEYRNTKTNTGTATDEEKISAEDYASQKKVIATARANAEIANFQQRIDNETSKLSNNNYSNTDKINIQATIEGLQSQIRQKQTELQTTLTGLDNVQNTAMQALNDEALDVKISNLENKGNYSEAQKLRLEKQNRAMVEKFTANNMPDSLKQLQENITNDQIQADYNQAEKTIENAVKDLSYTQEMLIQSVARGTLSAKDALSKYQTAFDAKTSTDIATLKADLQIAKNNGLTDNVRKIELKLKEITDQAKEYVDKLLKALDTSLEKKIQDIESNPDLTSMQKESQIAELKRTAAANKVVELKGVEANPPQGMDTTYLKAAIADAEKLSERLNKLNDINYQVSQSFKQSFESGLLTFLTDGITKCQTLGEAFKNLANTVISAIQRVYAEAITKDIMKALGLGSYESSGSSSGSSKYSFNYKNLFTPFTTYAEGGSMDSGQVKGPGTGTSDSILAYLGNFKKFVGISDGEYVVKNTAVKKFGTDFFDRLNAGLIPSEFLNIKAKFADGGSISSSPILAGPQDIAATLSSGDTNIHLKTINLNDPNEVGNYMQSRNGEKVMVNFMKNNAAVIRQVLKIKG